MRSEHVRIQLGAGESVSGRLDGPAGSVRDTGVILAHGAGRDKTAPLLEAVSRGLAEDGFPVLRFNFPYKDKGRKAPDRPQVLERTWAAALDWFRNRADMSSQKIVAAGKSMGGRIASSMAAAGTLPVDGLVFLGYPLHPPGRKDKLRDAHLPDIEAPMLFFSGTRDPLCDLELLGGVLPRLRAPWRLEIVEGGDHSFRVLKSLGVSREEVHAGIINRLIAWLLRLEATDPIPSGKNKSGSSLREDR